MAIAFVNDRLFPSCLANGIFYGFEQALLVNQFLGQIVFRSQFHRLHRRCHVLILCHHDIGNGDSTLAHPCEYLHAVTVRQTDVGQHAYIRVLVAQHLLGRGTVTGSLHLISVGTQPVAQIAGVWGIVFND